MALLDYCSMSLRTQAWPAIEFVSGKEGLRPFLTSFSGTLWYAVVRRGTQFTGTGFPPVHGQALLELWKSFSSLRGSRRYAPCGSMGLMAGSLLYAVYQMLSLGPSTVTVH